jgi:AbiTii
LTRALIDELQLDAADAAVSVSTLLRKALVVAARLGLEDVPQWINKELSGYNYNVDECPPYRMVKGRVRAKDAYRRFIDVHFDSNEFEQNVSEQRINGSIAELETLLSSDGTLSIAYPAESQTILRRVFESADAHFFCVIERARIAAILDQVRNEILRWAIALDKAGVRGEGLSFSPLEKENSRSECGHSHNRKHWLSQRSLDCRSGTQSAG